jgi:hypothetical protein
VGYEGQMITTSISPRSIASISLTKSSRVI